MKKLSGLLAVSLVAFMMAPAARAEIASTAYVDTKDTAIRNDMELKTNKATKNYTSGSTTEYPSIKIAEDIAKIAAGAAVGNYALKTDLEEEADARGQADTAINNKIGTVPTGKTVVTMIEEAKTAATYNDATVKEDIKKNADAITVINNSDVMKSGATKTKIDAIATNTANIEKKQDKLVASGENANIAGSDGVSVSIGTDGKITVAGNQAAIDTALVGKQDKLSVDQLSAVNSGITKDKVATYNTAVTTANNALPKATYDSQVGTVSAANMGTNAATVVGAIKEIKSAVSATDGATVKTDQGTANKDKAVITNSTGKVTTGQIANSMIANGAVNADKIAASAVTSAKIADGTIVNADISDSAAIAQSKISGLTDALAAKFVAPGTSVTSKDGTYTLTMKVADGKPTYAWEEIGR